MTDLRELLQECHAEILFWLPHRDSPPNRSRLLLERIDATLAHPPTVPTRNAQPAQQPVACSMCQGRKVVGIPGVTCEWCDGTGIDKIASELKSRETRNAQGEVDGGYFAEGPRMPSEHPLYEKVGPEQRGPQPAAPPTYAGPMWQPPEDWLKDHEIPALGSALQKLGSHLADMLSEDDWNNIEQMLFAVARESAAPVAAAQPPDAKPIGVVFVVEDGTGERPAVVWSDGERNAPPPGTHLYAAPQPPVEKKVRGYLGSTVEGGIDDHDEPEEQEPDCWAILTPNGSKLVPPQEAQGRLDAYPLYRAAPQPPAGEGDGQTKAWVLMSPTGNCCAFPTAESARRALPGWPDGTITLKASEHYPALSADAIPREIHERLLRDAKREALREAAAACVSVHEERKQRSGTDFGFNAIMECKEAIERMASEHERGGK